MSHPEAPQPPQEQQSPQPSGELVGSLSTPITRRHALELARNAVVGLIFLPAALRGEFDHTPPTSPPPTEKATSTVTPPSPPTVEPSPTATERAAIKEIELAPGSAVVDFPFDRNTPWEVADRFTPGGAVAVDGTITDPGGRQYHRVRAADGRAGYVLQTENSIPPENQTALEDALLGRGSVVVGNENPFTFKAGPHEEESRPLPLHHLIAEGQDFTNRIRGRGFAPFYIEGSGRSHKIHVRPNTDGTVTIRVEGSSQLPDDGPITIPGYAGGGFGMALRVARGERDDALAIESWGLEASASGAPESKPSIALRGGFEGNALHGYVNGTDAELVIDEMLLERGLTPQGVERADLILEHRKSGSIYESTGQKVGIGAHFGNDEIFVQQHGGIQHVKVDWMGANSRFFPGTHTHRGTYDERFTFQRLEKMGVSADMPIYTTNQGFSTIASLTAEDVRMDHEQVLALLTDLPALPIGMRIFDDRGGLSSTDPLAKQIYGATSNVNTVANAIALYNGLNRDPHYYDPIAEEYAPRPVNIVLPLGIASGAVQPILNSLDQVRSARSVFINAVDISPANLSDREVEVLAAGLKERGLKVRFNSVGGIASDGTPSEHTEASLQSLCERIDVAIDVMGTYGIENTMIRHVDGELRYNNVNLDGTPAKDTPYGRYMAAAR